jgi:hypothetical protein
MARKALFPKKGTSIQDCDDRLLSLLRHNGQFDLAAQNVENGIARPALREYLLAFFAIDDRAVQANPIKHRMWKFAHAASTFHPRWRHILILEQTRLMFKIDQPGPS